MRGNELDPYNEIIISALKKSAAKINKWREKFMMEVPLLSLENWVMFNFLSGIPNILNAYLAAPMKKFIFSTLPAVGIKATDLSFNSSFAKSTNKLHDDITANFG